MRLPAGPALLLLLMAPAARAEGGGEPPPKPPAPAPAKAGDDRDRDFDFRMARARDLAVRAVSAGDAALAREAYDLFLGAAHLRPRDPDPLAEAGLLALDFGDAASVTEMLKALFALAPESGAYHFLRGCHLQVLSDFADAREEFAAAKAGGYRAADAERRRFQCSVGLGLQYAAANLFDAALKTLSEAVASRPDDPLVPVAYYNMGVAHRRLQAPKEAEKVLRLSMERFPGYAPSYGELGEMLTELDRIDDAVKVLDMSVRVDPAYARGWILRAAAETSRGRFAEAEKAFDEYARRFKPTGLSEYHRGLFLQKKGEPAKAIECFQRSIAMDAAMIRAVYWIGLCYRDLGDEEKAAASMERWKRIEEEFKRRADEEAERIRLKAGTPAPPVPPPSDGAGPGGAGSDKKEPGGAKDGGGG